ncbi:MAG: alpha/beta fold hydrolase [Chloroflexi bacterium]|nr:alpha/beta fold hydrolase [Chloroflexota bacterium]
MVTRADFRLDSVGIPLAASLFTPAEEGPHPALVICHGMPSGPRPEAGVSQSSTGGELDYPALAEWCALEGFATLIFNFRGTGKSGGNFHPLGWAQDLESVLTWIMDRPEVDPGRIALLGSSLGATVAIYVAARRPEGAGVVSFASPAIMGPRQEPALAVERLREMGLIRDPDFPPSLEEWAMESQVLSPVQWVGRIAPRPLLLLHGDADDVVPTESVYTLFEHANEPKEMRVLPGVGHRFRSEPEAVRVALDWLKERFVA